MEVLKLSSASSMDSREIAERTGKQHAHVCRDIQVMLSELGEDGSKFGSVYKGGNGEPRRCYLLPKRECLILASGYSIALRAKIIDRWAELESAQAIQTPRSLPEALRLAADLAEKLEAAQPSIEFVARYVEAENTKGIREVAKLLPYSEHMDKGRFEVKTGEKHGHAFHQTRFTAEGIAWIAKRSKECV